MAVGDAHVFPGFLTLVLTQLSFQSHQLLFSRVSEERSENTPERKFASIRYLTHNHQVTSHTRSPLSQPDGAKGLWKEEIILLTSIFSFTQNVFNSLANKPWFFRVCCASLLKTLWEKEKLLVTINFSFTHSVFFPFGELSAIFIKFKIVVCKLFQFGRV